MENESHNNETHNNETHNNETHNNETHNNETHNVWHEVIGVTAVLMMLVIIFTIENCEKVNNIENKIYEIDNRVQVIEEKEDVKDKIIERLVTE
jgi:hypothetical protein